MKKRKRTVRIKSCCLGKTFIRQAIRSEVIRKMNIRIDELARIVWEERNLHISLKNLEEQYRRDIRHFHERLNRVDPQT